MSRLIMLACLMVQCALGAKRGPNENTIDIKFNQLSIAFGRNVPSLEPEQLANQSSDFWLAPARVYIDYAYETETVDAFLEGKDWVSNEVRGLMMLNGEWLRGLKQRCIKLLMRGTDAPREEDVDALQLGISDVLSQREDLEFRDLVYDYLLPPGYLFPVKRGVLAVEWRAGLSKGVDAILRSLVANVKRALMPPQEYYQIHPMVVRQEFKNVEYRFVKRGANPDQANLTDLGEKWIPGVKFLVDENYLHAEIEPSSPIVAKFDEEEIKRLYKLKGQFVESLLAGDMKTNSRKLQKIREDFLGWDNRHVKGLVSAFVFPDIYVYSDGELICLIDEWHLFFIRWNTYMEKVQSFRLNVEKDIIIRDPFGKPGLMILVDFDDSKYDVALKQMVKFTDSALHADALFGQEMMRQTVRADLNHNSRIWTFAIFIPDGTKRAISRWLPWKKKKPGFPNLLALKRMTEPAALYLPYSQPPIFYNPQPDINQPHSLIHHLPDLPIQLIILNMHKQRESRFANLRSVCKTFSYYPLDFLTHVESQRAKDLQLNFSAYPLYNQFAEAACQTAMHLNFDQPTFFRTIQYFLFRDNFFAHCDNVYELQTKFLNDKLDDTLDHKLIDRMFAFFTERKD